MQGVFFRYAVQDEARAHGVAGWVRNLRNGRVEAVFEGDAASVQRMVEFCHRGPTHARVDRVVVEKEEPRGEFRGFEVRPTT
ncbi:putative acylphosphate phosphohydrolase [hydrocarbon metagenome]|uniref:Putative acylphosphate phosphohydrolase n=1 Tax=hydrocarbon metagenome TaxID=938273 RepID=A0A0W8FE67_9ZZZZ